MMISIGGHHHIEPGFFPCWFLVQESVWIYCPQGHLIDVGGPRNRILANGAIIPAVHCHSCSFSDDALQLGDWTRGDFRPRSRWRAYG